VTAMVQVRPRRILPPRLSGDVTFDYTPRTTGNEAENVRNDRKDSECLKSFCKIECSGLLKNSIPSKNALLKVNVKI